MKFNLLVAVMAFTLARLAHGTGHGITGSSQHRSSPHGSSFAEEHNSATNHPVYTLLLKYHPAEDFEDENIWTGEITIATRVFNVIFATGSSDLWVPSPWTTSFEKNKYDGSSPTRIQGPPEEFEQMNNPFTPQDGHGFIDYKQRLQDMKRCGDNVEIGHMLLRRQHFGTVGHFTPYFLRRPLDGVLGLGFPELADNHYDPFFYAAYQQRTPGFSSGVFAFYLTKGHSEFHIDGTGNPNLFDTKRIEYHSVVPLRHDDRLQPIYSNWMIGGGQLKVTYKDDDGQVKTDVIASGIRTIIDSGTDMILGPAEVVKRIYERIPFSQVIKNSVGLADHVFPCNLPIEGKEFPKITFSWGGAEWDLSLDSFILARFSRYEDRPIKKPAICRGAIQEKPASDKGPDMVLGTSFMLNVYSIFDMKNMRVGLSPLRYRPTLQSVPDSMRVFHGQLGLMIQELYPKRPSGSQSGMKSGAKRRRR